MLSVSTHQLVHNMLFLTNSGRIARSHVLVQARPPVLRPHREHAGSPRLHRCAVTESALRVRVPATCRRVAYYSILGLQLAAFGNAPRSLERRRYLETTA